MIKEPLKNKENMFKLNPDEQDAYEDWEYECWTESIEYFELMRGR